ncbi:MAG: polysaccharide pyruvyl transferase [Proteobacteria bacterium]|nr:polysaccharide pyruvyl transferase [Pseudomonadota bacterium]
MKYVITHCYTDKNKGDAAIVIATTQLIHRVDKKADISMLSTYGEGDMRLQTDHKIIGKYANRVLPSIFPEPVTFFGFNSDKLRIVSFIINFLKSLLLLVSKNRLLIKLCFKEHEVESINIFLDADIILSKGGSFLYTENASLRQFLSLIRMLYPFVLAKRYNKKSVIFSQSLGPVIGQLSQWLFRYVIKNVDLIYLRESLCLEKYDVVKHICHSGKCKIIPDSAFYLKHEEMLLPIHIDHLAFNVGYTIVDHDFKYLSSEEEKQQCSENYIQSIIDSMKHLIDTHNAVIHIFPQVTTDISHLGHNDMKISKKIKDYFDNTKYENSIKLYTLDLTPMQLRSLYEKMEIFIGTRLHSVIFALSVCTPSINISYHGTKSKGILKEIKDYEKYVVDINTINSTNLMFLIEDLLLNRIKIKNELTLNLLDINQKLENAIDEICTK